MICGYTHARKPSYAGLGTHTISALNKNWLKYKQPLVRPGHKHWGQSSDWVSAQWTVHHHGHYQTGDWVKQASSDWLLVLQGDDEATIVDIVNSATLTGVTPLHKAAKGGHLAAVDMLLAHGAHPFAMTATNCSALHIALEDWHIPVVKRLLEEHTACKAPFHGIFDGWTPLMQANRAPGSVICPRSDSR